VGLETSDISNVDATMTIQPPVDFVGQLISGGGLPPNLTFVLLLGGVVTNAAQTGPGGDFSGNFDVTNAPKALPRTDSLEFDDGEIFQGVEAAGPYPHVVPLSPSGELVLRKPQAGATAVITGAGFPENCETSGLYAVLAERELVPLGGFNTPANGFWSFNFNFPPAARNARSFLWQGGGNCDGLELTGRNPGGPFPRDIFMAVPE
jgi:hypothetical protein